MRSASKIGGFLIVGILWAGFAPQVQADDPIGPVGSCLYSNSINDLVTRLDPGVNEVGDQIIFELGTPRYLGYFDFQYWGWNSAPGATTFGGEVEARIRFYSNTGDPFHGYDTPSSPAFYDSDWFGGFGLTGPTAGYRATIYFVAGSDWASTGLLVPDEMTWSVQFRGMGATDTVGVDLFSPPTVGQNYDDYWKNVGTEATPDWRLMTNSIPLDFGARFYAVPEPSFFGLSVVGGLGILMLVRRLRGTA